MSRAATRGTPSARELEPAELCIHANDVGALHPRVAFKQKKQSSQERTILMTRTQHPRPVRIAVAGALLTLLASLAAGCASDHSEAPRTFSVSHSLIPTAFYVDDQGESPGDATRDDAGLRKLTEDGSVPVTRHPSGEQVTWGTFRRADGELDVACTDEGTELELSMTGLLPQGVYTGWIAFFAPPGYAEAGMDALTGFGPVGPQSGAQSVFVADANGVGDLTVVTPPGALSVALAGPQQVPACLLDAYEVHVIAAYHMDGKTYGGVPGDADVVAEHLAWVLSSDR